MMKHLITSLLLFCSFFTFAQPLDKEEARFFAEILHQREILTVAGYSEFVEKINGGRLGTFTPRRSMDVSRLSQQSLSMSTFIGYLAHAYSREYDYRTAKTQLQEKAMSLFGTPPPNRLSAEQEETLLAWARSELADEEGPAIERALGHDVFAAGILPPFFMQFALSNSIARKDSRFKAFVDAFEPQISTSRSVLGYDVELLLEVLEELGIVRAKDRAQLRSSTEINPDRYVLSELAKIVEARESRPRNIEKTLRYLDQAYKSGLLRQEDLTSLRNDSTFLHGSRKLPAIRRFQRGVNSLETDINPAPGLGASLKLLEATLSDLDPVFSGIGFDHEVTPNDQEPTQPYQDGPDLTITITGGGKDVRFTERTGRGLLDDEGNPQFHISPELVSHLNDYLVAAGSDQVLYALRVPPDTSSPTLRLTQEALFLLLTKQEAKTLIVRTMEEMYMGPGGFSRRN